ncbi:unnamed protein product [Amoebophrya sp. A25]|nr:unnamed protein product [Amoebophrya sp. A25]|eukprot:GSA25T00003437001.1
MSTSASSSIGRRYNAVLQQTMLRIRDPKVSVPFYEKHFGMQLIHKYDFPQWKFSLYFLERTKPGTELPFKVPEEVGSKKSEEYLWNMSGGVVLELTHNHGSESDENFKPYWSGNSGKDAPKDSPLYIENGPTRGFGHIAFNVDDVYAYSADMEAAGVKFQKRPDEGRMKGLAFALDPDGYWVELVKRGMTFEGAPANLSQTMMRVKDADATIAFYQQYFDMTLIRSSGVPNDFTNYFLVSKMLPEEEKRWKEELNEEPKHPDGKDFCSKLWYPVLELTHNHGTENDSEFQVCNGNPPNEYQGWGHIGFIVDDLHKCCAEMEEQGVKFFKRPQDGNMNNIAFALDPSGYRVELVQRGTGFL